jgi:hypothetical protein
MDIRSSDIPAARRSRRLSLRVVLVSLGALGLAVILPTPSGGAASSLTLPESFQGSEVTWNYNGSYYICQVKPGGACSTGRGTYQWHVFNVLERVDLKELTFKEEATGPGTYDLTAGTGTITGTESNTNTYTDMQGGTHVCNFTTRRSIGSGPLTGSLLVSPAAGSATITIAFPTQVAYGAGTGDCGTYDGYDNRPPPASQIKNSIYASGVYGATKQAITLNKANCSNGTCTTAGSLTGAPRTAPGRGPPAADQDCQQQASGDEPCSLCPDISVVPGQLAPAQTGHAYLKQLMGILGQAPYAFSTAGPLPAGLRLSSGGLLAGTVTSTAGTYPVNFNMVDARGCNGTNLSLQLYGTVANIFPQEFTLLLHVGGSRASGASPAARGPYVVPAAASPQVQLKFSYWEVDAGGVITAKPGSVVALCSSRELLAFRLDGLATHISKGQNFSLSWYVDGHLRRVFPYRWVESGSYPTSVLLGNPGGLPTGLWRLHIAGGTTGHSQLTITTHRC